MEHFNRHLDDMVTSLMYFFTLLRLSANRGNSFHNNKLIITYYI